jgi:hypothetical protein
MCLAGHIFYHVIPILLIFVLGGDGLHRKRFLAFPSRTNIGTIAATQTVEHVNLNTKTHTCKLSALGFQYFHVLTQSFLFIFIEHKRTYGCMRTNVSTLVALDAVFGFPLRNENGYAAFFVSSRTRFPTPIFATLEYRYRQIVATLSVHGTYHFPNKFGSIVLCLLNNLNVSPFFRNFHFFNLATSFYCGKVHFYNIFALSSV